MTSRAAGEMAVRQMSAKAQKFFNETDPMYVEEYEIDVEVDGEIEFEKKYNIKCAGDELRGLTFDETEKILEGWQDDVDWLDLDPEEERTSEKVFIVFLDGEPSKCFKTMSSAKKYESEIRVTDQEVEIEIVEMEEE